MRMHHVLGSRPVWSFVLIIAGLGCTSSTEKGKLFPEGDPVVMEVFMNERLAPPPNAGVLALAYGCSGDNDLQTGINVVGDPNCADLPSDPDQNCADKKLQPGRRPESDILAQFCWDRHDGDATDNGHVDGIDCPGCGAIAGNGQQFRIILDELLLGKTVEQFECACNSGGTMETPVTPNCPNGISFSLDPTVCDNNPTTDFKEQGRFTDLAGGGADGVPDKTALIPGFIQITCDAAPLPYINQLGDTGWYNPSGNQQLPVNIRTGEYEWDAMGPAIVLSPPALPTGANCSLHFNPTVIYDPSGMDPMPETIDTARDKDGNPIPDVPGFTFVTENMVVASTMPQDGASGVPPDMNISVQFNVPVDMQSAGNITLTDGGGAPVAKSLMFSEDGSTITINPNASLAPGTYTVTVPATTVTDRFGSPLPFAKTFTFTV